MQNDEFSLNGYRLKRYNESNFVLIFHQKYSTGGLFANDNECNKSLRKNKFSVIGSINDNFKISEYFHLLLEYPELDAHLEWKQKLPITSSESNVQAIVYNKTFRDFHGLAKSADVTSSCLDGSPGTYTPYWFYSIGMKRKHVGWIIPGPLFVGDDSNYNVDSVFLWMKYDDINLIHNFPVISYRKPTRSRVLSFVFYLSILVCRNIS